MAFWPDLDCDYDDRDWNEGDHDSDEYSPRVIACKHCRATGFTWKWTSAGWRLQDKDGTIHLCLTDKARAKNQERAQERRQAFHEISVALNGRNPSIDDINRMARAAAAQDKQDRYR